MSIYSSVKLVSSECKNLSGLNKFTPACNQDVAQELLDEIHEMVNRAACMKVPTNKNEYGSYVYHISDFGLLKRYQQELHLYAFNKLFNEDYDMDKFLTNVGIKCWKRK